VAFSNIVGHERQKELLLSYHKRDRVHHAFLFSGQDGIGKKKLALEFAALLLCETGTGCGVCRPCVKVGRGNHPDVVLIEEENTIGIDQSRAIGKEVAEPPYEGSRRVIIIDRADTMTREATNALLKTLEEPPPFNHFFLVTSSEKELPLTIKSRCVKIAFSPLGRDEVKSYFTGVLKVKEEEARTLSLVSFGSIGYGLFWMDKENLKLRKRLASLIMGHKASFVDITAISEKVARNPRSLAIYLFFVLSFLRDLFVTVRTGDSSLAVNRDLRELMVIRPGDREWVASSIGRVQETIQNMRYNVNKWVLFENLLLQVVRFT
jgi:DNA polymerase-3 subunit delta'